MHFDFFCGVLDYTALRVKALSCTVGEVQNPSSEVPEEHGRDGEGRHHGQEVQSEAPGDSPRDRKWRELTIGVLCWVDAHGDEDDETLCTKWTLYYSYI